MNVIDRGEELLDGMRKSQGKGGIDGRFKCIG